MTNSHIQDVYFLAYGRKQKMKKAPKNLVFLVFLTSSTDFGDIVVLPHVCSSLLQGLQNAVN